MLIHRLDYVDNYHGYDAVHFCYDNYYYDLISFYEEIDPFDSYPDVNQYVTYGFY